MCSVFRQLTESAEIVSIANDALNTSREAMRIAEEALDVPDDTKQKVDGLDRDMASLQAMYEQTLRMSESALQQATQAFDDSAAVSVRADALLQSLDIDALRQEAADINQTVGLKIKYNHTPSFSHRDHVFFQASNTKDEAARLIAEHEALIRAVQQQKLDAEALLAEGEQEQQVRVTSSLKMTSHRFLYDDILFGLRSPTSCWPTLTRRWRSRATPLRRRRAF